MRVIYISYLHPAVTPGGAQQVAFELFQASLKRNDEAFFIAALEPHHEQVYGKPGAPIVPVQGEVRQYFYFPQHYDFLHLSTGDLRACEFLRDLVEKLSPDVIHFHHYHRIGVESIRAARSGAPRAVIGLTFHEMMAICMADGQMVKKNSRDLCYVSSALACNRCFPDLRPEFVTLRAARLKAMLNECDVFIFPSEFLAGRYLDWGLAHEKCIVVPNGQLNLGTQFEREHHSPALNRFGFFGQFIDNKGVDVILDALLILGRERRVPTSGIVVEINGGNRHYASAPYLEEIKRRIEELGKIQSNSKIRVIDRGSYGREQLAERMSTVDWVLVPSTWWEVFGLVVSEAWMFGRPVIASAIAGLKERIVDGKDGFTFAARDSRALADRMVSLSGNEQQWTSVNRSIELPPTEIEMLEAYSEIWEEFGALRPLASEISLVEPIVAASKMPTKKYRNKGPQKGP